MQKKYNIKEELEDNIEKISSIIKPIEDVEYEEDDEQFKIINNYHRYLHEKGVLFKRNKIKLPNYGR